MEGEKANGRLIFPPPGGSNPALRTVYYRLLRLLSHNITPLFVFDGPYRPAFKRGHKTNTQLTPALIRLSKKLLKLFGCPFHTAPGEAEAECALLNREGIVDAVLSEDVDTLMFGANTVIRKWSGEGKNSTPTHVTIHNAREISAETGLTREGMVLVALMRGGDYLPEGIPGCGIKTAVEAAKAGFGADLFEVRDDEQRLREWRERLQYEMSSNESGWFKRKNGRAVVSANFPNKEVLGFYAEPVVSGGEKVERLREAIEWDGAVDVVALREYARDTFEWRGTGGAAKFVRTLAPVLLAQRVWNGDKDACKLISRLHGRRDHFSTDGCMELRISYTPVDVVPINKELEQEDDQEEAREQAGVLDDDDAVLMDDRDTGKNWDPYVAERIWMLESFLSRSMQETIQEYDDAKAAKAKPKSKAKATTTTKAPANSRLKKAVVPAGEMAQAPMKRFLKVSKHGGNVSPKAEIPKESASPVINRSVSQAVSKTKSATLAVKDNRTIRAASSSYVAGRNPPSPTKAPIPSRHPITMAKRSDAVRTPSSPTKASTASRAVSASVSSPTKASRTVSISSPAKPSRTVSVSSPTKVSSLNVSKAPNKRPNPVRAVSATVPSWSSRQLTSPRKPLEITREEPAQETDVPSRRTVQKPVELRYDSPPPSLRPEPPVGRLAYAIETIDLMTPSPSRPSTPPLLHIQTEEIEFQTPTEGLLNWIEGVHLASPRRDISPIRSRVEVVTRPRTPPQPQRPSPGLRRVASGTVAALVRNLETIAVSSSPVMPETPLRAVVPGRPVDFEAVQNSPNITVHRRRARKPRRKSSAEKKFLEERERELSPIPSPPFPSPEVEEVLLTARSGNVVSKGSPTTVRVAVKEWAPGVWQEMEEHENVDVGYKIFEDVEVVDLTAA